MRFIISCVLSLNSYFVLCESESGKRDVNGLLAAVSFVAFSSCALFVSNSH